MVQCTSTVGRLSPIPSPLPCVSLYRTSPEPGLESRRDDSFELSRPLPPTIPLFSVVITRYLSPFVLSPAPSFPYRPETSCPFPDPDTRRVVGEGSPDGPVSSFSDSGVGSNWDHSGPTSPSQKYPFRCAYTGKEGTMEGVRRL